MIARLLESKLRRRYVYAAGELLAMSIATLCAIAVLGGVRYQINAEDHGIAPFTAGCVGAISLVLFIVLVLGRMRNDDEIRAQDEAK